jgi:signal transduction histidine kinase/ligand-binding sensor domain-containing protein
MHFGRSLLLGLLATCGPVRAQELFFRNIGAEQGLSDLHVTCIRSDGAGGLLVGTGNGLFRYDGQLAEAVSGLSGAVSAMEGTADGRTWIGTLDKGLYVLEGREARSYPVITEGSAVPATSRIHALHAPRPGSLVVGGTPELLRTLDIPSARAQRWSSPGQRTLMNGVIAANGSGWCHSITAIDDDRLWVGVLNGSRSLILRRSDLQVERVLANDADTHSNHTRTCAVAHDGLLYTGGWQNGVEVFDMRTWSRTRVIATPDETTALCVWQDLIIIGTKRAGLLVYDPKMDRIIGRYDRTGRHGLPSAKVRALLSHENGQLWVGTEAGLSVHDPMAWPMRMIELPSSANEAPEVLGIEPGPDGAAYVLGNFGIFIVPKDGSTTHHPLPVGAIATRLSAPRGHERLVGTERGLMRMDHRTWSPIGPFRRTDLGRDLGGTDEQYQVRGVFLDRLNGAPVWVVGALGYGVVVYSAEDGSAVLRSTVGDSYIDRAMVRNMARSSDGTYWWASDGGLIQWDIHANRMIVHDGDARTPVKHARGVLLDGDTVWSILRDEGLVALTGDTVRVHGRPEWSSPLIDLCRDHTGYLWISTSSGLERYDPSNGSWYHVPVGGSMDQAQNDGPITCLSTGTIAFTAGGMLHRFDPDRMHMKVPLPTARIAKLECAGASLPLDSKVVELTYRNAVLDVRLSALGLGATHPVELIYRLHGVEREERTAAAGELIRYAGLPVGTHRLMVSVRDVHGQRGVEQLLLEVHVEGPFWQQWWFFAIGALAISLLAYSWSRYRIAQAMKLQQVRDRIASDLHDEVGSSLSSITIGSRLAADLSKGENEQVRALLARIGETSSESLRSISDIVWAIDPKNDQGEALVKRMRRIAYELLEQKGIPVSFDVSGGVEELRLSMNTRKEIVLIFKEAVHNASKYSGADRVKIALYRQHGSLTLTVEDNGCGFDPDLHTDGHGLGSMSRRAHALGSVLELTSGRQQGTSVRITVDLTGIRD